MSKFVTVTVIDRLWCKGVRTLRHQDSSAPNNWCRSVR